jgi:tetratricopeptide (TPR) repeat protein
MSRYLNQTGRGSSNIEPKTGARMLKRKATDFIGLILACIAVVAVGGFSQAGAETPDYLVEYKLHTEALANGDRAAAAEHGKAAWEAAEAALGDDKLTATLAFNYGRLIALSDPATARAPLRRAQELLDAGIAELPKSEVRAYLAYAEYIAGKTRLRAAKKLREALLALEAEFGEPTATDVVMWLDLAKGELKKKRYSNSLEAAEKAEAAIATLWPDNIDKMGEALLIQGIATLVPFPRTIEDVLASRNLFRRIFQLYPPQKNFETFDVVLAKAIAWDAAANAALLSRRKKPKDQSEQGAVEAEPHFIFESAQNLPDDCGIEWDRQIPPTYPDTPLYRGYIGAVMVVYDLGDDLVVHNPRILSSVPTYAFTKEALKSLNSWKLKAPSVDHPACRTNRMTQFTFVIKE